ncbi:hypothetical protein [Flammeovirga kamogawensis]|uniref:DUF4625 domain-containing protein n=1 Tax=Flammeovirga kamogawensis TaxID=373891 RepID=A0ABX8GT87_9BACT|nr:hypothetical protein [Flammeovirga kamogawensis]MBB6462533.1 hypothetical protein [Flammeovirga kamogawensis]QWG06731.1 hypothetical protein KM029_15685 [Flammeovirga kamogawensis]TRX68554.1 hypothetical protein EO216_10680 [Flammeovirga kamogawensis]
MKRILISIITFLSITLISSCAKENPQPSSKPSITSNFTGASFSQGNFHSNIDFNVNVPSKISHLVAVFPTLEGSENATDLASEPQDQQEFEAQDILLIGKTYLDVKGAQYARVELQQEYLNELKPGLYTIELQVEDANNISSRRIVELEIQN